MNEEVIKAAQKTFIALKNPYGSVERVFPNIIEEYAHCQDITYLGVKNVGTISIAFIHKLKTKGFYLHTLDKASVAGRAVDISLKNPYTGLPMTGSSSGTAINVLIGVNDIGVGTDGGGSVLAPAMAVNLIGFISPLLDKETLEKRPARISTDGLRFKASLGCISKELKLIERLIEADNPELTPDLELRQLKVISDSVEGIGGGEFKPQIMDLSFKNAPREKLISKLSGLLDEADVLISKEGPIDLDGFGDSVLGHHDDFTRALQDRGNKGFIRVANIAGVTAITIPAKEFATGYVFMCHSEVPKIKKLLGLASRLYVPNEKHFDRYFSDSKEYFPRQFGDL